MIESRLVIGQSLKKTRTSKGFTQTAIQSQTGISRSVVSDIERGAYTGTLKTLEQYAFFLGFEISLTPLPNAFPHFDQLHVLFSDEA